MVDSVEKLPVEIITRESDPFSDVPLWSLWFSTIVLSLAFIIGLPLNGATVLIFWRRKKLRHLVNFVLLLDCLSHIVLCLVCIPIHLVTVWSSSSTLNASGFSGLAASQQVVGNFSNVYSTFLTVSIAILRYRRLCWKKKDKFSTRNAVKWSVLSGCVAVALTVGQSYSWFLNDNEKTTLIVYLVKISLILLSMAIVFFCYIRVSQRVWANAASQEKVMDPMKLKKSRSVHLRATIHSCVQIILVILTLSPHLYEQTLQAFYASNFQFEQTSLVESSNSGGSGGNSMGDVIVSGSLSSLSQEESSTPQAFNENFNSIDESGGGGDVDKEWTRSQSSQIIQEDSSTSSTTLSSNDHFARLIGITINYALLVLGTPVAYIASCHRFREQFTSILFSHIINSPQNSAGRRNSQHQQKHRTNSNSSSIRCRTHGGKPDGRHYSNPITRVSGRPFSSSVTTRTTTLNANPSSVIIANPTQVLVTGKSNLRTCKSLGGSIKSSKGSTKRTTSLRRKGSRGLLGTEFIIVDSDSTAILQEQDLSNSTNPKETPTPSPTMTEAYGDYSCSVNRKASIFCLNSQSNTITTATTCNHPNSLQTILQNYRYEYGDFGQLV